MTIAIRSFNVAGTIGCPIPAVYNIINQRAEQAGISKLVPHNGRRTFVGELLDNSADIVTVQKRMGHSDPKTTASYDRRNDRARTRTVNTLHMPWSKHYASSQFIPSPQSVQSSVALFKSELYDLSSLLA